MLSKKLLSIFSRSSRYREVELKASITYDWLSFEREHEVSLLTEQTQISYKRGTVSTHRNTYNLSSQFRTKSPLVTWHIFHRGGHNWCPAEIRTKTIKKNGVSIHPYQAQQKHRLKWYRAVHKFQNYTVTVIKRNGYFFRGSDSAILPPFPEDQPLQEKNLLRFKSFPILWSFVALRYKQEVTKIVSLSLKGGWNTAVYPYILSRFWNLVLWLNFVTH